MGEGDLILLVDGGPDRLGPLELHLRQAGYRIACAATGLEALCLAANASPALLILDASLPDLSGLEVCRRMRCQPATRALPIIMLTAYTAEVDRTVAQELGAYEYMVKPASVRELVRRVDAMLRRPAEPPSSLRVAPDASSLLRAGPIEIDPDVPVVRVGDLVVQLAHLEHRLLRYLAEARSGLRSRDEILRHVWGYQAGTKTRTLDTHVKRLRRKLGAAGRQIETVHGVGYRLQAEPR